MSLETDLIGYGLSFSLSVWGVFLIINAKDLLRKDLSEEMKRIGRTLVPVAGWILIFLSICSVCCIYFDWYGVADFNL